MRTVKTIAMLLAVGMLLAPAGAVQANLIQNPGFEADYDGDLNPDNWSFTKGDRVKDFDLGIAPHSGALQWQFQNDNATLSQTVAIPAAGAYDLSMWLANRNDGNHHLNTVASGQVKFELLDNLSNPVTPDSSASPDYDAPRGTYVQWTRSFNSLAAGNYTVLVSTGDGPGANQGMGDDFSLVATGPPAPPSPVPSYPDAVNALNPHGYWRLGESAGTTTVVNEVDITENGEYQNGPILGVAGIPGGGGDTAADFDGGDDRVRMMDPHHPTDYTLTAWVKMDTVPTQWQNILWRTNSGESAAFSHILQVVPKGNDMVFKHYTWDGHERYVEGVIPVVADQWYHLAGVYHPGTGNSGYMSLYVNGNLEKHWTGTLGNPWNGGDRWLLADNHASGVNFDGTIDDVAIFHSLLTADEIAGLYEAGITPSGVIPEPITMLAVALSLGGLGRYVRKRRRA